MNTVLLTWNAKKWPKSYLDRMLAEYAKGQRVHRWSCGVSKKISEGDRTFLMRQGEGRGLFGSGYVAKAPFADTHFEPDKAAAGETAYFVMVQFDHLCDPFAHMVIPYSELKGPDLDCTAWNAQGSGKRIPDHIARRVEEIWASRTGAAEIAYPDDLPEPSGLFEGAVKRVSVNRYERDPEARRRCLARHGYACTVCGFHFEYAYGSIGKGYIHVHHLKLVSSLGPDYEINPEEDLRPVCPNCHAMLHTEDPPLTIERVQALHKLY